MVGGSQAWFGAVLGSWGEFGVVLESQEWFVGFVDALRRFCGHREWSGAILGSWGYFSMGLGS